MKLRILASIAGIVGIWWMRSRLPTKRQREGEHASRQQGQSNDPILNDSARVSKTLESIFKEYKARNSKADRQRPQDQMGQRSVARWAVAYTIITGAILAVAVWQSFSVQRQLYAALTTNRAWISINPSVNTAITFDASGGHYGLAVTLKNVGHSPATGIGVAATGSALIWGHPYATRDILASACERASRDTFAPITLFPDDTYVSEQKIEISLNDVALGILPGSATWPDSIVPLLYVCAVYNDAGSGSAGNRTAIAYTIGIRSESARAVKTIPIEGDKAVQDILVLRRDTLGGSIVD